MHSRRYPIDRYNRRSLPLVVQGGILQTWARDRRFPFARLRLKRRTTFLGRSARGDLGRSSYDEPIVVSFRTN